MTLIAQIVIGIALVIVILFQRQSSELGGAFGGSSEFFHTKRGLEKILFRSTIALAFAFFILALINVAGV